MLISSSQIMRLMPAFGLAGILAAVLAPGYTTIDKTIGYRLGPYDLTLEGYNLSNRRPPVTQSEFGDSSYYLLPARAIFVKLSRAL